MISSALEVVKKIGNESFNKYVNVFLLISEINGALKKDDETIFLFNEILEDRFNENIFFLLCNINPKLVNEKLLKSRRIFINK